MQSASAPTTQSKFRYFDIAANLTSGMYAGYYKGQRGSMHAPDLDDVLKRAHEVG